MSILTSGNVKRNEELFDSSELQKIEVWLKKKIEEYKTSREELSKEWQKWNRVIQCVYNESDHFAKTNSKVFTSETQDAVDTISKRICVATLSSNKITDLLFENDIDEDTKEICKDIWQDIINRLNPRKIFSPIIRSGGAYGTYIAKVLPKYQEKYVFKTEYKNGKTIRVKEKVIDTLPEIKYQNIFDLYVDPTVQNISESDLIAEKLLISTYDMEEDDFYMTKDIISYEDTLKEYISTDDTNKKQTIWDSGVNLDVLTYTDKRMVYNCYFDWEYEEELYKFFAVIDALSGKLIRIEPIQFDNNNIPYVLTPYIYRNDLLYGIGICEQGWAYQIMLNDIYNQYLDNIDLINDLNILIQEGNTLPNEPIRRGRLKLIPVVNPQGFQQLRNEGLGFVQNMVDNLKFDIQKKTKATLTVQGLPLSGNRTAREAQGIREEINVSFKDIIDNVSQNFLYELFNLFKDFCVQFYKNDNIVIKRSIDGNDTNFQYVKYNFDDYREYFSNCKIQIINAEEVNSKAAKYQELRNLLQLGFQTPQLINIPYLMKKIYFDELGFTDYDKFVNYTVSGKTMDPTEENDLMENGQLMNTGANDDHEEHLRVHNDLLQVFQSYVNSPEFNNSPEERKMSIGKILFNISKHIQEHVVILQNQQQPQEQQPVNNTNEGA